MADNAREAALFGLRQFLNGLAGEWLIIIYLASRNRHEPSKVVWPRDETARDGAFGLLRAVLLPARHGGEIRVRRSAKPHGLTTILQWPEPDDLFAESEPPVQVKPKMVERLASGEEREVKRETV